MSETNTTERKKGEDGAEHAEKEETREETKGTSHTKPTSSTDSETDSTKREETNDANHMEDTSLADTETESSKGKKGEDGAEHAEKEETREETKGTSHTKPTSSTDSETDSTKREETNDANHMEDTSLADTETESSKGKKGEDGAEHAEKEETREETKGTSHTKPTSSTDSETDSTKREETNDANHMEDTSLADTETESSKGKRKDEHEDEEIRKLKQEYEDLKTKSDSALSEKDAEIGEETNDANHMEDTSLADTETESSKGKRKDEHEDEEIRKLKQEYEDLKTKSDSALSEKDAEIGKLKQEHEDFKTKSNSALSAKDAEIRKLKKEHEDFKNTAAAKDEEIRIFKSNITALEAKFQQKEETLTKEVDGDKCDIATVEGDSFVTDLSTLTKKNESLGCEVAKLTDVRRGLDEDVKRERDNVNKLKKEYDDLRKESEKLKTEKDEQSRSDEKTIRQLQQDNGSLSEAYTRLRDELDTTEAEKNSQIAETEMNCATRLEEMRNTNQKQLSDLHIYYQDELRQMNACVDESDKTIMTLERDLKDEKTSFEKQVKELNTSFSNTITTLTQTAEKDRKKYDALQKEKEKLTSEKAELVKKGKAEAHEKKHLKDTVDKQKQELERLQKSEDFFKNQVSGLQTNVSNTTRAYRNIQAQLTSLTSQYERTKKENMTLVEENKNLTLRLSKVASAKLTTGNPSIADLSDESRPTKLGERFSELYDNEWTDAYEELTLKKKIPDAEAIGKLLELTHEAFWVCSTIAKDHLETQRTAMKHYGFEWEQSKTRSDGNTGEKPLKHSASLTSDLEIPTETWKMILDQHKANVYRTKVKLSSMVLSIVKKRLNIDDNESMDGYIKTCAEICWLMVVQDPPVVVERLDLPADKPVQFDKDRYRPYTKTGKAYSFIVWPALLLYENGPLLAKGVAQGCPL